MRGALLLGEEAQQETKKKTVQDYLQEAKKNQQAGNTEMAFQQYMIAARDYGHPEAQFEVARCYQNGTGVEKSEENALVWYKKAAEQCDAEAQCALGECYYQARGVEKDDKEARIWYEAAATQGNVTAHDRTAVCGTLVQCGGCEVVHQSGRAGMPGSAV